MKPIQVVGVFVIASLVLAGAGCYRQEPDLTMNHDGYIIERADTPYLTVCYVLLTKDRIPVSISCH